MAHLPLPIPHPLLDEIEQIIAEVTTLSETVDNLDGGLATGILP